MRSKSGFFLIFCSALTSALIWVYSTFDRYFVAHSEENQRAEVLAKELRRERFKRSLAEGQLTDFSTAVAALQIDQKKMPKSLERFQQVLREPAAIRLDLSGPIFERGKKFFSEQKYREASIEFRRLRETFPLSPFFVESVFLSGEAAFLSGLKEECLAMADLLVEQYPEHELTGFLLLRIGQLSEESGRVDEAESIYQTVSKSFKNAALQNQAKEMSKALKIQ